MYYIRVDYYGTGEWTWVHYPGDEECVAWDKKLKLALNDVGSLEITYAKTNPVHGRVVARRTLIEVLQDNESLFIGEVRDITHDKMHNESIYAVGALAWLRNSIQGQEQFKNISIRQFLAKLLDDHNKQCPEHPFLIGIVDVTEPNPDEETLLRYTNYGDTWATIKDRLIDRFDDVAIRMRRVGANYYVDLMQVQTYGVECEQDVRFGENLLDYSDTLTTDDVCSSVVPLGATITDEEGNASRLGNIIERRVTIESVNDGKNYLENSKLVERFGHIRTTHSWTGVKTPEALKRKALKWITDGQWEKLSLKVKVADLTLAGEASDAYRVGDRAYVVSEAYGLRKSFPIRARTYDLDNPENDEMQLGASLQGSYVASSAAAVAQAATEAQDSQYVQGEWLRNSIENVTAMMTGARGGYKFTEYDEQGRWLADYIMDSMDKATAKVVCKTTKDGTAYSTSGVNGPYETAVMANGTVLGKFIEAHSVKAEQIATEYTSSWQDADETTLKTARTEFKAADKEISAKVTQTEKNIKGLKTDLKAEIKVRADQISQTVQKGKIGSAINQSAEKITIKSDKFGWQSTNSSMTTSGILKAKKAVLENAEVSGTVTTGAANGMKAMLTDGGIDFYDASGKKVARFSANKYGSVSLASNLYMSLIGDTITLHASRYLDLVDVKKIALKRDYIHHEAMDEEDFWDGYTGNVNVGGQTLRFINGLLAQRV